MSLDTQFVASLVEGGYPAIRMAIEAGIEPAHLTGQGVPALEFVIDYGQQFKKAPTPDMVRMSARVSLPQATGPADYFIQEIQNRRLHEALVEYLEPVMQNVQSSKPQDAFQSLETAIREIRKLRIGASRVIQLTTLVPDFLDQYERLEKGERGILTPWPTVNDATMGFWPEDFILYVARQAIGKTWLLTILANHAWVEQGKRVLFVTTEMSREKIMQRWVSLFLQLPADDVRRARLSAFAKQGMIDGLAELADSEGFYIVGGDFDFQVGSLEGAIEEVEPDVVYVDGVYLLKAGGAGRVEKAANSFDELKRLAKRNHLPVVCTTQFNRQVDPNKSQTVSAEKIALSDAAGWNADLIYGLIRTEEMMEEKQMLQKPLKFREGQGEDVECWWDFDTMNFAELPKGAAAAGPPLGSPSGSSGPPPTQGTGGQLGFDVDGDDDAPF
jgi:replicative DNA helicase